MDLQPLLAPITNSLSDITASIEHGQEQIPLALRRAARLPVLAALYQHFTSQDANRPIFLLTDRADRALILLDELRLWLPEASLLFFPEPTPLFYEQAVWGENTRRERLAVLTALAAYHIPGAKPQETPPIIIAPLRAVMARTMPRRDFLISVKTLKIEQVVRPDELARQWVELGYEAVNIVTSTGQFSRRGGILDVWPPAEPQPVRIEFFGDEIDTLRRFDPATQRTTASLERMLISPAREYILPTEALDRSDDEEPPDEYYLPQLHPMPASAIEYLPRQGLIFLDDHQALADIATEIEEIAVQTRADMIADGSLPVEFPVPYISWSELEDSLPPARTIELGGPVFDEMDETLPQTGKHFLSESFTPGVRFAGRLRNVLEHLAEVTERGEQVYIVSRQYSRLEELWQEQVMRHPGRKASLQFIEGSLTEGFTFSPPAPVEPAETKPIHLLTDGELFGWRRPEARRRARLTAEAPESAYADLEPNDWVVHVDHGVGRYLGLVRRTVDGIEREYLAIEYEGEAELYVPVYQADRLTRYVGPDSREPRPSRLGSTEWKNDKAKAKEAAEAVARELLELYATRQIVPGHSFAPDSPWQQELEASFAYIETPDQKRVIADVKSDMEASRPMDRLLCGDVGYGKTEVALRAAFKAVMDGKQVALLVPTTVLAQQHYHTFQERLAAFPATVEMLSRFRTPQQQREILYKLKRLPPRRRTGFWRCGAAKMRIS